MSIQQSEAGAYEPRPGDRVTVRRYIKATCGPRTLHAEHTGVITDAEPHQDGWFLNLDNYPDRIFIGYQFLGAGAYGRTPASLVTEVALAEPGKGTFGRQLTPELVVATDGSQCVVLLVGGTGPADPIRKVAVTDVTAFKGALDDALAAQQEALTAADRQRYRGPDEKRRAEGRLTRSEAVAYLAEQTRRQRGHVVAVVSRAQEYPRLGPERFQSASVTGSPVFLVGYADGYWQVVPAEAEQAAR